MKYVLESMTSDYYSSTIYRTFECDLSKVDIIDRIRNQAQILKKFEEEHPYPEKPDHLLKVKWNSPLLDEYNSLCKDYAEEYEKLQYVYLGDYEMRVTSDHTVEECMMEIHTLKQWYNRQALQHKTK